jgi:transcriptional regulator with XRE-family HTH domain
MNNGESLRYFLYKKKMNQADFAEKMGTSAAYASVLIHKKHWAGKNIDKAAKIFGVSASEFIQRGEDCVD